MTEAEQQAKTIGTKEEAAIRAIFHAMVADCQSNGDGNADGHIPFSALFDLSCVLDDPLSPVEMDRMSKIFGNQIEWSEFFDFWKNDDFAE